MVRFAAPFISLVGLSAIALTGCGPKEDIVERAPAALEPRVRAQPALPDVEREAARRVHAQHAELAHLRQVDAPIVEEDHPRELHARARLEPLEPGREIAVAPEGIDTVGFGDTEPRAEGTIGNGKGAGKPGLVAETRGEIGEAHVKNFFRQAHRNQNHGRANFEAFKVFLGLFNGQLEECYAPPELSLELGECTKALVSRRHGSLAIALGFIRSAEVTAPPVTSCST